MSLTTHVRSRLKGFFGLSLLLHLNLAMFVVAVLSLNPQCGQVTSAIKPVEVALLAQDEVAHLRGDSALNLKQEELKKEEKKEEEQEKDIRGQVVDIPRPAEEKQPAKSRFLSEYDSTVAKEKKGPAAPTRPGRLLADQPGRARQPLPPQAPPEERQEVEKKALKLAMRGGGGPDVPQTERPPRGALPRDTAGDEPAKADPPDPQPTKGPKLGPGDSEGGGRKRVTLKDLRLSDSELARAVGSRASDYLKDVEEGDQTLLNTKRWRFATFFNRVKRQVSQNWHPDVVYRRRDPNGNVYGFRDRLTILRVRLTPEGRLKELQLEKACGVGFLDDEAISAFKAAEPFPNPPPGLVDKDTRVISFRFGFLFEISSRPGFRIFRYNE